MTKFSSNNFDRLILVFFIALSACGPQTPKYAAKIGAAVTDRPDQSFTGGTLNPVDPESPQYTSYGDFERSNALRSKIPVNEKTTLLASNIKSLNFQQAQNGDLTLEAKWGALEKPLVFQGKVQKFANRFVGEMRDTSGQRPDLVLKADCAENPCSNLEGKIIDGDTQVAFSAGAEETDFKVSLPQSSPEIPKNADPEMRNFIEAGAKARKVLGKFAVVYPGMSSLELNSNPGEKSPFSIMSPLLETNGLQNPVKTTGVLAKYFDTYEVGNNSAEGSIVFVAKAKDSQKVAASEIPPELFIQAKRPKPAPSISQKQTTPPVPQKIQPAPQTGKVPAVVPAPAPGAQTQKPKAVDMQADLQGPRTQTLQSSLLSECSRPEVVEGISDWKLNRRSKITNFLTIYEKTRSENVGGISADFQKMLSILSTFQLPKLFSFVTLQESGFGSAVKSKEGAIGVWQFMPITIVEISRRFFPFSQSDARVIGPATKAASYLLNDLLKTYKNNIPLSLAAYNRGGRNINKAITQMSLKPEARKQNEFSLEDAAEFTHDYWKMRYFGMMPRETRDYVPSIYSAACIGHSPKTYGFDSFSPWSD